MKIFDPFLTGSVPGYPKLSISEFIFGFAFDELSNYLYQQT